MPRQTAREFHPNQIEGQNNASLFSGLAEDFPVGEPVQSFVTKVNGIMTLAAKPVDDTPGNTHVGKKSHGQGSGRGDLFLGKPSGIPQGFAKILRLEVGIVA